MTTEAADPPAPEPAVPAPAPASELAVPAPAPAIPNPTAAEGQVAAEPAPAADAYSVADLDPVADPAQDPAAATDPDSAAAPAPKKRPRGRTALIMVGAVVLGVLGGGGAGYAVQSARKPTPLPPLAVAQPKYPAKRVAAPALPASQDDQVKTDGDLTKLLVPAPAGMKPLPDQDSTHFWESLADYAENYTKPGVEFKDQADSHFRRAAVASWYKGAENTTVYLVQYAHGYANGAQSEVTNEQSYAQDDTGGKPVDVPHYNGGEVYPGAKKLGGSNPYYEGRGYAQHGDIAVEVFVDSAHPVSAKTLLTLIQSQLERL
ncbi:hypothetical protein [Streptacidiphilus cavernicola]|uniref:Uncharacterized protein n=1 Tax=Streptacidiphilus cavernicola TaxID=3342716 RepID=A0ABV6VW64_9ACTN